MARLLITGGAGFIGSHTCLVLLQAGHSLVVLDNFSNSSPRSLERVLQIAKIPEENSSRLKKEQGDVRDLSTLERLFIEGENIGQPFEAVIHFAGLKAVAESFKDPCLYWDVNVGGSRTLLSVMEEHGCRTLVFSSSATLYGYSELFTIPETAPIRPVNPYGSTKAAVESLLADVAGCSGNDVPKQITSNGWRIARLRYFNPVGAHPSGRIGEESFSSSCHMSPLTKRWTCS